MMKLNDVINDSKNEMTYWYKQMEKEETSNNDNKASRIRVCYRNLHYFFNRIVKILESYRTLSNDDLISKKKLESIEKEVEQFSNDTISIRVDAERLYLKWKCDDKKVTA